MALPPLPAFNTNRYKLQYTIGGLNHEVQNRVGPAVDSAGASAAFNQLLTRLSSGLWEITVTGMTFAAAGSDIFNPSTYTGGTVFGSGAPEPEGAIRTIGFVGRTSGGRKARHFVYGWKLNFNDNMRITRAESAIVANWLDDLATYAAQWLAIDGLKPVYRQYANIDYNDHWQQVIRG